MTIPVTDVLKDLQRQAVPNLQNPADQPNPLASLLSNLPLRKGPAKDVVAAVKQEQALNRTDIDPDVAAKMSSVFRHNADPAKDTRIAFRDIESGEFASPEQAAAHPAEVVTDFIELPKPEKKKRSTKGEGARTAKKSVAKKGAKKAPKKSVSSKAVKKAAKKK